MVYSCPNPAKESFDCMEHWFCFTAYKPQENEIVAVDEIKTCVRLAERYFVEFKSQYRDCVCQARSADLPRFRLN